MKQWISGLFRTLRQAQWIQSVKAWPIVQKFFGTKFGQAMLRHKRLTLASAAVLSVLIVLLVLWACGVFTAPVQEPQPPAPSVDVVEPTPDDLPATDEITSPEPQILAHLAELYEQNPDLAGWLKIEGTPIDYPVMYTPDDPEKYLRTGFEGTYDFAGELFFEDACSLSPESDNLIIYGHNMLNGSMFRSVMAYKNESHWKEHPTIEFSTLYEQREYEVLAAFYDRVYYKWEDTFKFYQFIDAENEEEYNEAISYYKEHSVYDTGVHAEYGDRLLTLVTCSYHTDYGRFVVVAREISDQQ